MKHFLTGSTFQRIRQVHQAIMAMAIVSIAIPFTAAHAQGVEGKTVKAIDVRYVGSATVSKDRILSSFSTKVGDPLSVTKIDEDIKALYSSGDVENVRVLSEPLSGGVKLIIEVQSRAAMGEVNFTGNTIFSSTKLRKEVDLSKTGAIDEESVQKGRSAIMELYRKKGFPEATVSYNVSAPNAQGYSTITYKINEGGRGILRDVQFIGNSVFSSGELRKQMEQKPKSGLNPFGKAGRIDGDLLEDDIRRIEAHYADNGYLQAKVINVTRARDEKDPESVDLIITLDEGDVYYVNSVSVNGVESISLQDEVIPYLSVRGGDVYSGSDVKADLKLIDDQYGTKGYVEARVTPILKDAGQRNVDIVYDVSEGRQYRIGQIDIEGNFKTQDRVIRRELGLLPGEPFDSVALDATKDRLMNMNYFASVDMMPVDTSYIDEKNLLITVTERPTGTVNFGAGFSSIDDLVGFVEVTQTNFDIGNWPSLTGAGQRFRMSARVGTERKDFQLALTEPWFMGKRLALTGEVFYRDLLFLSDFYDQTVYGGTVSLRKPVTKFGYANVGYTGQMYEISPELGASEEIQAEGGDFFDSLVSAEFVHDTRDSVFLAREGHKVSAGVEYSGLGGDVDSTTFSLSGQQHFSLPYDSIFSVLGRFNNVSGDAPIFKRQFLGGANNLRGFDYRDVGPKDETGEPLGGDQSWFATAELSVPIVEKVRMAAFYDIGEVSGGPGKIGGGINSDYGLGLRLFVLGNAPIRLDYGIPVQEDEFNGGSGRFNFTMGYQF